MHVYTIFFVVVVVVVVVDVRKLVTNHVDAVS